MNESISKPFDSFKNEVNDIINLSREKKELNEFMREFFHYIDLYVLRYILEKYYEFDTNTPIETIDPDIDLKVILIIIFIHYCN